MRTAAAMLAAACLTIGLGLCGPAMAQGFVETRSGWLALSPEAKAAYVQGMNDSLNFFFVDDTLVDALAKRGRTRCLMEQRMNAASLSALITAAYQNPEYAQLSPVAVYILRVGEMCRAYINRERQEFGLGPQ